tara:strand:- start:12008 stop:13159 length:1152 start_codon:yes stop_codon:yes gene_type:complete
MTTSGEHQLSLISSFDLLQQLEEEWDSLLVRSEANSIYLTWAYITTWWKTYGHQYRLLVILARDSDGKLSGIAPMMIGKGDSGPTRQLRCLSFLGSLGDTAAEFIDFIVTPGLERTLVPQFYDYFTEELESEWDLLTLRQVESRSLSLNALLSTIAKHHGTTFRIDSTPSPYTTLPSSWDEYLGSRSKNFRKAFKGHWNRLHKNYQVAELVAGRDISLTDAMDHLMALNKSRWEDQRSTFNSSLFYSHHLEVAKVFRAKGWLHFRLLEIDDRIVSARLDFCYANKLWNILGGWDPNLANLSLGRIAIAKELQWCIDHKIQEYDFLGGESSYKRTWASSERTLIDLVFSNPASFKATALDQLRCLRDFVRPKSISTKAPLFLPS